MTHWPAFNEDGIEAGSAALRGNARSPGSVHVSPVPAVERAIAILRLLESNVDPASCTVSGISRALGLNKSTCSNILRTLESNGFIEHDAATKTYWLGAGLIGLSIKARHRTFPSVAVAHLQALVRQIGFTCVAFEQLPNGEFVIVGKVESQKDIKVTIDVGQRFPPAAPVFARVSLAWSTAAAVEAFIAGGNLQRFTRLSKTDPAGLRAELEQVRREGYSVSVGEYYLANTAIAAPVFSVQRDACRGICMVGFTSEVSEDKITHYAEAVRDAGLDITEAMRHSLNSGRST